MIEIAKLGLYGMFINYYPYNIMFGHFIPNGTLIFFAMVVFGVIGDIFGSGKRIPLDRENKTWILYFFLSLATSVFSISISNAVSSLMKYSMRLFITIAVTHVCRREKSIKFSISLLSITALLSAIAAFLQMNGLSGRLSILSDAVISVNDFGSMMAYGCFSVILFFKYSQIHNTFLKTSLTIGCILLFIVEIFLSGSRKSFYGVIILFALLFLFVWRKKIGKSSGTFLAVIICCIAVYFIAEEYLLPSMQDTSLYLRIWGRKEEAAALSDEGRLELYKLAFQQFLVHPLFGLGFNNYVNIYGMYSHSTYAEPLACSGIISLAYFIPLFRVLKTQFKKSKIEKKSRSISSIETELLIFYLVFLFIGIGIPYMYKDIPCIVFGMMIAHQTIEQDRKVT